VAGVREMPGGGVISAAEVVGRAREVANNDYEYSTEFQVDGVLYTVRIEVMADIPDDDPDIDITAMQASQSQRLQVVGNQNGTFLSVYQDDDLIQDIALPVDPFREASLEWAAEVATVVDRMHFTARAKHALRLLRDTLISANSRRVAASFADACAAGY
jgi:hypothetical protein